MHVEYPLYIPSEDLDWFSRHLSKESTIELSEFEGDVFDLLKESDRNSICRYIIRDDGDGWPKAIGGIDVNGFLWGLLAEHKHKDRVKILRHAKDVLGTLQDFFITYGNPFIDCITCLNHPENRSATIWYRYIGLEPVETVGVEEFIRYQKKVRYPCVCSSD